MDLSASFESPALKGSRRLFPLSVGSRKLLDRGLSFELE